MKPESIRLAAGVVLLCAAAVAQAALTCTNPASTGFQTAISARAAPNDSAVPNITQGTVTFNCTRTLAGDATSVLLWANDGLNASPVPQNRARRVANYINYELYQDSACAQVWTTAGAGICGGAATCITVPLLNALGAQAVTVNFWGCVPLGQVSAGAGNHTDTVSMRVRNIANTAWITAARNLAVTINSPGTCSISTLPGDISFTYTAFSPQQTANTTFAANCTNRMPYTLSLDSYFGNLNGVHYDLDINGTAPSAVDARGTGVAQSYTINATVPGNQAGTCATAACPPATKTHTLTVTY